MSKETMPQFVPLPGPKQLLRLTWPRFIQTLKPFIGMLFVTSCLFGIILGSFYLRFTFGERYFPGVFTFIHRAGFFSLILLIAVLVLLAIWLHSALIVVAVRTQEKKLFTSMLRESVQVFPALLWVVILHSLVVWGGMLFLLIPGYILAIWLVFAPFIAVAEKDRGYDALCKSREYVRGHFFAIFGRIIVPYIPLYIFAFLMNIVPPDTILGKIALIMYILLSVLSTLFYLVYTNVLYEQTKAIRGLVQGESLRKQKIVYKSLATLSVVCLLLVILLIGRTVDEAAQENKQRVDDMRMMRSHEVINSLQKYKTQYGIYPESLSELKAFDKTIPFDADTRQHVLYSRPKNSDYLLCTTLITTKKACFTASGSVE